MIAPIIIILLVSFNIFLEEVSFGSFFSWYNKEQVTVWLRFPSGAEFSDIKKAIAKFEVAALEKGYKKEINTQIWDRGAYMEISFPEEVENSAFPSS